VYKCNNNKLFLKIAFGGTKLTMPTTTIMTMMVIIIAFKKGSGAEPFQFLNGLRRFHKNMYELLVYVIESLCDNFQEII
jgi:hypothetical protein